MAASHPQEQVNSFTQKVVRASSDMLLVYAPNTVLLGTMWAAHRINLGAPVEFSIKQGKTLGMEAEQGAILRNRLGKTNPDKTSLSEQGLTVEKLE